MQCAPVSVNSSANSSALHSTVPVSKPLSVSANSPDGLFVPYTGITLVFCIIAVAALLALALGCFVAGRYCNIRQRTDAKVTSLT